MGRGEGGVGVVGWEEGVGMVGARSRDREGGMVGEGGGIGMEVLWGRRAKGAKDREDRRWRWRGRKWGKIKNEDKGGG